MIAVEEWVDIRSLHKQGYTIAAIVRELGVARNTVRRALRQDQSPRYTRRKPRASKLDPYKDYLKARLREFPALSGVRLLEEIQAGRFRDDLFYRLNVVTLNMPSLRDRKQDIPR